MQEKTKHKVLVVDDDERLLQDVKGHLERSGYKALIARDGLAALAIARTHHPDLVILDITFPDCDKTGRSSMDGVDVLRLLREMGDVPVLMLSATSIAAVKVMALTIGADDYITKPFVVQELLARVDAILRRASRTMNTDRILNLRRICIEPGKRQVLKDGNLIDLTGIEFDILHTLARRPEHVFTREKLIELAWKESSYCVAKAVDVHIGHIRKKLEDEPCHPKFIVTVRGTGYRFEDVATGVEAQ